MRKLKVANCATPGCKGEIRYYNMKPSKYCKECLYIKQKKKWEKHKLTKVYQKEVLRDKEKLRKKCVALAKKIAKSQQGNFCQYSGKSGDECILHCHHIFSEGLYKSMSADPDNLIVLWSKHHLSGKWNNAKTFSFHGHPRESTEWYIKNYPENYKKLLERSKQYQKLDIFFWENKLKELKKLIK